MPNLRRMVDGDGSLVLNVPYIPVDNNWKAQDDFVLRRKVNRSGPTTSEVLVGKILAMHGNTADVSIQKPGGISQRAVVNIKDIVPVTESFKRQSMQFNNQIRHRL